MKGMSLPAIVLTVAVFGVLRVLSPFEAGTTAAGVWPLVLDALVVMGLGAAASAFTAGDPPRRGWIAVTLSQTLIWVGHTLQFLELSYQPVIVVANLMWIVSILLWVRTFGTFTLAPEWTTRSRIVVGGLSLVAVGTAGASIYLGLQSDKAAWDLAYSMASAVADAAVFIGAVLLVRLLLPMSGGAIARPYLLLCISAAVYLALDLSMIVTGIGSFAAFEGGLLKLAAIADGTSFAAGVAQAVLLRARD